MRHFIRSSLLLLYFFIVITVPQTRAIQAGEIDPAATELLKRMTDNLASVKQFSVSTQNTLEDTINSGHRIDIDVSAKVIVRRPNKIRSERKGDRVDQVFYYDGKNMTLYHPAHNLYSTVPAPDTFKGLFIYLYETLGFALPISDLLYEDSYSLLMEDVTLAQVISESYLAGDKCYHLLFSRPGVDFQIWIADGPKPLPLKYVVTDTALPVPLSISTRLSNWDLEPFLEDSQFVFSGHEGAQSITFLPF